MLGSCSYMLGFSSYNIETTRISTGASAHSATLWCVPDLTQLSLPECN